MSVNKVPTFNLSSGSSKDIQGDWIRWVRRFENYLIATDVRDDGRKKALLLNLAGEKVFDAFEKLPSTGSSYKDALKALNQYFYTLRALDILGPTSGKMNETYEKQKMNQINYEDPYKPEERHYLNNLNEGYSKASKNQSSKPVAPAKNVNLFKPMKSFNTSLNDVSMNKNKIPNKAKPAKSQKDFADLKASLLALDLDADKSHFGRPFTPDLKNSMTHQAKQNKKRDGSATRGGARRFREAQMLSEVANSNTSENRTQKPFVAKGTCKFCGKRWPHGPANPCSAVGKVCFNCGMSNHLSNVCKWRTVGATQSSLNDSD